MIKLKIGRKIYELDSKDIILDNGVSYQIITQKDTKGFSWSYPVMSKKLFNDLKKSELIFTNEELQQAAIEEYNTQIITYWKFNITKMKELGY